MNSGRLLACATLLSGGLTMTTAAPAQPLPAAQVNVAVPAYERIVLPNGATLLLMERRDIPLVGFQALVRGGVIAEPADKSGTASVLAELLEKGAGARDAFAFADAVADVGGVLSVDAGLEAISISGEFLARDQSLMIELLADVLQRPRLDAGEFASIRERQVEFIRAAKDGDLSALLPVYGAATLFKGHPYARPVFGTEASLEALAHADVAAYYRAQFGADRLVLAVTGDFRTATLREALTKALGGWGRAASALPSVPAPAKVTGRRVLLVDAPDSVQTYLLIGNVGVPRSFRERAALDVVNTLFGGRFTSMLNSELRIKSGLTYGARSQFVRPTQPGAWQIATYTRTEATQQATDLALDTFAKFRGGALDETQLQSGKNYVIGQFPTQLETAPQWARQLAELEFYGLDRDYVGGYGSALQGVTLADATRVTQQAYPGEQDLAFVFIGDAAAIREQVAKYGPVTEIKLAEPRFAP